jgi:type VI secretion system protein ImpB
MASTKPRLAFSVDNKLTNDGTQMGVELILSSMDDFLPVNVVKQMPELAKLYDARTRLNDMLAKLEGNEALDSMLIDIMTNKSTRDGLVASLKAATTPATK